MLRMLIWLRGTKRVASLPRFWFSTDKLSALERWRHANKQTTEIIRTDEQRHRITAAAETDPAEAQKDAANAVREWEASGYSDYMSNQRKNGWKT